MKKTVLLFDIDGTLLLTGGAGKIALEQAFEELFGIAGCWGATDPHGKTDPAIIQSIAETVLGRRLTPEEDRRLSDRYHELFRLEIARSAQYRLMPGVPEILEFLSRRREIFLALGTGNFERAGWMKLEKGDIHRYFKCGGFGSDAAKRPEILRYAVRRAEKMIGSAVPREQIYVIGDTEYDIAAAREAGLRSIAVLTNGRKGKDFEKDPPDYILKDLTNIPAFMACLSDGLYPSRPIPF